jgi:hypothetical protein
VLLVYGSKDAARLTADFAQDGQKNSHQKCKDGYNH